MSEPARHTQRVRVTSSRRGATTARRRPPAAAVTEQTGFGELYLQGLLRAQLRLSLIVLGTGAAALLGLPVLFAVVPATRELRVAGLPFPWLVLGLLLYPAVVGTAAWFTRQAEQTERRFLDVLTRERE